MVVCISVSRYSFCFDSSVVDDACVISNGVVPSALQCDQLAKEEANKCVCRDMSAITCECNQRGRLETFGENVNIGSRECLQHRLCHVNIGSRASCSCVGDESLT